MINDIWPIKNVSSFLIMGKPLSFYGEEYLKMKYPWELLEIKRKIFDKYHNFWSSIIFYPKYMAKNIFWLCYCIFHP